MPVSIKKTDGHYQVRTPNQVHAKATTKGKAKRQARLLNAVEHGWKPTGKKSKKVRSSGNRMKSTKNQRSNLKQGYRKV